MIEGNLALFDSLNVVEYLVFHYEESSFGTILTTKLVNILQNSNKSVIIFNVFFCFNEKSALNWDQNSVSKGLFI